MQNPRVRMPNSGLRIKCCPILTKIYFVSIQDIIKPPNVKFYENPCKRRPDFTRREADITTLIVVFRNFKRRLQIYYPCTV
jgi:hypothetical protein